MGQLDRLVKVINHIHLHKHKEDKKVWTLDVKLCSIILEHLLYSGLKPYIAAIWKSVVPL